MKKLPAIIILFSLAIMPHQASADFTIGCSHWENAAPALPDFIYNWCEVTLLDEEIVANVSQIGIDSNWESDVYYQVGGAVWALDESYDDDAIQDYPGPFVTGNIVNDWADLTDVYGRVRTSGQLLDHNEYCWTTNFLYFITGTGPGTGWTTYSTDSDCEVTSGFTF